MRMSKSLIFGGLLFLGFGIAAPEAQALSVRHHVYNMARQLKKAVLAPLEGVVVKGPRNIREAYQYEVWGREEADERGRMSGRLFALWRAPGEQLKGMSDGVVESVSAVGEAFKEFLSIFFSD